MEPKVYYDSEQKTLIVGEKLYKRDDNHIWQETISSAGKARIYWLIVETSKLTIEGLKWVCNELAIEFSIDKYNALQKWRFEEAKKWKDEVRKELFGII